MDPQEQNEQLKGELWYIFNKMLTGSVPILESWNVKLDNGNVLCVKKNIVLFYFG